jgi:hypothetical protein
MLVLASSCLMSLLLVSLFCSHILVFIPPPRPLEQAVGYISLRRPSNLQGNLAFKLGSPPYFTSFTTAPGLLQYVYRIQLLILQGTIIGGHLVRYPWSMISDWTCYRNLRYWTERKESNIISDIGINFYPISNIPINMENIKAERYCTRVQFQGARVGIQLMLQFFITIHKCWISEWTLVSISEHFRYRNDSFQSDIFVSYIGITDVDVGCRISLTLKGHMHEIFITCF